MVRQQLLRPGQAGATASLRKIIKRRFVVRQRIDQAHLPEPLCTHQIPEHQKFKRQPTASQMGQDRRVDGSGNPLRISATKLRGSARDYEITTHRQREPAGNSMKPSTTASETVAVASRILKISAHRRSVAMISGKGFGFMSPDRSRPAQKFPSAPRSTIIRQEVSWLAATQPRRVLRQTTPV